MRENYARVEAEVEKACASAGRKRTEVRLIAVSKFHSVAAIREIAGAGQRDFGENYVQEANAKREALEELGLSWHMIGNVQTRKAVKIAGRFALLHTLDRRELADALEKRLNNSAQDALIEVNIGGEAQKSGIAPERAGELAEYVVANCPHLRLKGLMCLPPVFDSGDAARPYFAKLRELRDALEKRLAARLPELSMGMSGDFQGAIAEGATIVRIGTSIFGPRPLRKPAG